MDNGYGVTAQGFVGKDFNTLVSDVKAYLIGDDLFGADIDFSDKDPLYHFSVPFIEIATELWELGAQVFYSASPKYAEGTVLAGTGKYIGISLKQAIQATTPVRFIGTAGTVIPNGYQVGTISGINFTTTETMSIQSVGYVDIPVIAVTAGVLGNVPINTIISPINPIIGLNSITNLSEASGGQDQESDVAFRTRYDESTSLGSGSTSAAIEANVLQVTGVTNCTVTENNEDVADSNGIPPHSFLTLVNGGSDNDIANAIFEKKAGGIKSFGITTTVSVTDSKGIPHNISFSRPTQVPVYIKILLTTDSTFPTDGDTQIQNAILTYIDGIGLGDAVILYKITSIAAELNLGGLTDMQITLSTDGITYSASNIQINSSSIAITDILKTIVS